MASENQITTGGGAATTSGTTFQEDVTRYFSILMLAEISCSPHLNLPPDVSLAKLIAESLQSVDDLAIITSDGGVIYIQAKRRIACAKGSKSDFAGVVAQFVGQKYNGTQLPGKGARAMDPELDRLVLAVSPTASNVISISLATALNKVKTISDPDDLPVIQSVLNQKEDKALNTLRQHISREWRSITGVPIDPRDELNLLHLIYVLPLDLSPEGGMTMRAKDLLRTSILKDPTREYDAFNALIEICRNFAPHRAFCDLAKLRLLIQQKGIQLKSTTSYRDDIAALQKYSDNRIADLKRFSFIPSEDGEFKISRKAVSALCEFANGGHVVVVGEPGAGKSGCIYELATRLLSSGKDVVTLTADMLNINSSSDLTIELGLSRSRTIVDVLANWDGDENAFLILDALDSARATMSVPVLCNILENIQGKAPRWKIVASVREYDLSKSDAIQKLFQGTPNIENFDKRFPNVRHLSIKRLSKDEWRTVLDECPEIETTIREANLPIELLQNLFNLKLLFELTSVNVTSDELSAVRSQLELLSLYWKRRVEVSTRVNENDNIDLRNIVLSNAVAEMVRNRELHVGRQILAKSPNCNTTTMDFLCSDGVLVSNKGRPNTPPILGFVHNIIFDYAVCRLWIADLNNSLIAEFTEPTNYDLLLAIRPSLSMAFEEFWNSDERHGYFWNRALAFCSARGMRLIGKIIPADVAADKFNSPDDFLDLLSHLNEADGTAKYILRYVIQAAITRHENKPNHHPMAGRDAPAWPALAVTLISHIDSVSWEIKRILIAVGDEKNPLTMKQQAETNLSACEFIRFGVANDWTAEFMRPVLDTLIKTMRADVSRSKEALIPIVKREYIEGGRHEFLRPLANGIRTFAEFCPDLALEVVTTCFTANCDKEEMVQGGSQILPISFRKVDLMSMGMHRISEVFPDIARRFPLIASRILIVVINATVEKRDSWAFKNSVAFAFMLNGNESWCRQDGSFHWAKGDYNRHDDWYKILGSFTSNLIDLGKANKREHLLTILEAVSKENRWAIIWSALLNAAAATPKSFGPLVAEMLCSRDILTGIDTADAAMALLKSGYRYFSKLIRLNIEKAIREILDRAEKDDRPYAIRSAVNLLNCIPSRNIQSSQLKKVLNEANKRINASRPCVDNTREIETERDHDSWNFQRRGIDPDSVENAPLIASAKMLNKVVFSNTGDAKSKSIVPDALAILQDAESQILQGKERGAHADVVVELEAEIAGICEEISRSVKLSSNTPLFSFVRGYLLKAARSTNPVFNKEDDERWAKDGGGWPSPSTRISAACGLMYLASNPETVDSEILEAIEVLALDAVASVRFQIIVRLLMLWQSDYDLMWRLIALYCAAENRAALISSLIRNVALKVPIHEFHKLEPHVRLAYRRCRREFNNSELLESSAIFYIRSAMWRNNSRSRRVIEAFTNCPHKFTVESNSFIKSCRNFLRCDLRELSMDENTRIRKYAFARLTKMTQVIYKRIRELQSQHMGLKYTDWPSTKLEEIRVIHNIIDNITSELYFSSGAFRSGNKQAPEIDELPPPNSIQKTEFYNEARELIDLLCNIEFVGPAYRTLEFLEFFIEVDPHDVLLKIAALLRKSATTGIQYEGLAVDATVRVIERYLAEYRQMLRDDEEMRIAIIEILDIFVEAGWPKATTLTYSLNDVFR